MDRQPARAHDPTSFAVHFNLDLPAHCLWVTVLIATPNPRRIKKVPGVPPRLAIPTGVPI